MGVETGAAEGQSTTGPQDAAFSEITGAEPQSFEGQSTAGEQITNNVTDISTAQQQPQQDAQLTGDNVGPANAAEKPEQWFFDPHDLPAELLPAYKNMQAAFTKKTQAFSEQRHKIDAYDAFEQNPVAAIQQIAQQYGFQLIQPGQQMGQGEVEQDWTPQTWEEVLAKAEKQAEQKVLQRLEPLIGKVQQLQQSNTEAFMDNNFPDWRQYEDEMHALLKAHPTLANDPGTLYKMAVPDEVLKSRAAKIALQKLQNNTQNAQVSSQSTTHKPAAAKLEGPLTFNQAVEIAKARIAKGRAVTS